MNCRLLLLFFLSLTISSFSQLKPENGLAPSLLGKIAITNIDVYITPENKIENATMLIEDGKIQKIGKLVIIPDGYVQFDREGMTAVPAFVELISDAGVSKAKSNYSGDYPQLESSKKGDYYWNEAIHPELDGFFGLNYQDAFFEELLKNGFGFVAPHQMDGIVRGTAPLLALGVDTDQKTMVSLRQSMHYSFQKGVTQQTYPSSLMGSIALLRQAFYDLKYLEDYPKESIGKMSLLPWLQYRNLPSIFHVNDKWDILRAAKISEEFKVPFIYATKGDEYAIAEELKSKNVRLIVPLALPKPYEVSDPYIARSLELSDLKHWECAPYNYTILNKQGLKVALTSRGIPSGEFWKNIHKLIQLGAKPEQVLASLTTIPAEYLEVDSLLGTLEKGKYASFGIYSKDPFLFEATLHEAWNLGQQKVFSPFIPSVLGRYSLNLKNKKLEMKVEGNPQKPSVNVVELTNVWDSKLRIYKKDSIQTSVKCKISNQDISLEFNFVESNESKPYLLTGKILGNGSIWEGDVLYPDGSWGQWSVIRRNKFRDTTQKVQSLPSTLPNIWFPNMSYGNEHPLKPVSVVFENVNIWTNEAEGNIDRGFVVVEGGKIAFVGKNKPYFPPGAQVIDGSSMHLTSGIIDEHSHIAISRGVNEGGQSVSAEVSIGDVVYPEDISIYRQLAGGVTAAQLLHGSANAIGGQSALIKLKWGAMPETMKIENAPGFIKCALGENVKQSNWGDRNVVRFPQTRMGVEQVFYDAFYRAKKYRSSWDEFLKNKASDPALKPPRKDLELEVLLEILDGKRFITCHSYVQSEVNMLMKVADSMGFKVNTFTHILEGYKVADKMKQHGVGGSTFADWWAYKFEVNEAIPYNAALMHQQGLVVAINSDDAEMGRRLNQEAAKTVKYGGLSEVEAWKTVTLNPAKLLHLDHRMGSIAVGKDADLVLWNDHPLSINARVKLTMIEGVIYFDEVKDLELQSRNKMEKMRIIALMNSKSSTSPVKQPFFKKSKRFYHCDTMGEEGTTQENLH
jgi:imidazolonepropionase-like amidohydrolase